MWFRYWQLAELPQDKKGEWVNLDDVTRAENPMLMVAAQAAWGADDTWKKLEEDHEQWPIWKYLKKHAGAGFIASVQVGGINSLCLHLCGAATFQTLFALPSFLGWLTGDWGGGEDTGFDVWRAVRCGSLC